MRSTRKKGQGQSDLLEQVYWHTNQKAQALQSSDRTPRESQQHISSVERTALSPSETSSKTFEKGVKMAINISASPTQKIDVTLVGKKYKVSKPKAAVAINLASKLNLDEEDEQAGEHAKESVEEWVDLLFNKTDAAAVKKRLYEPTDSLDFEHIGDLMGKILDDGENPTTSSSA